MTFPNRRRAVIGCALWTSVSLMLTGCGLSLASLPLPAPNVSGRTFGLTAVFASALNLPAQAKVKLNGADIGQVESLRAQNFTAQVRMRIRDDAPLYTGATAELRSATPLGDLFVAIRPDPNQSPDARRLRDGDTIPLTSTSAAATVEELLSSMALLVNGGAIRQMVNVINGAGDAMGGRGEKLNALVEQSTTLVSRLNARSAEMDRALRGTADMTAQLASRRAELEEALKAAGPATAAISENTSQIADLVNAVSGITVQLDRFPSLQGTDTRSTVKDLNSLAAALNTVSTDPNLSMNNLNRFLGIFIKTTTATAARANVDIRKLALGWLPDKNYPGDPGMHFPDGTDYHLAVGSLRYEWNMLLGHIYGSDR